MATGAVMPVDSILLVKADSLREVLNSFFVFEKSVPYQPATVVARRIVSIRLKHLVEIFKGQRKSIASNFFAYRAKMVHCLDVRRLEVDGVEVIVL